ncbi:hypothetical protein [Paraburkholderia caledonica]|uniref:Uncharacterized protein n=1 Tax=Paraburkholderia caledonica TaxID=134536 RepID=A0AB73IN77_9BURK|nr:hypothetical protein [Paraburkholderia caledonica]
MRFRKPKCLVDLCKRKLFNIRLFLFLSILCDVEHALASVDLPHRLPELRQDYVAEPRFCSALSKLLVRARGRYPQAAYLAELPLPPLLESGIRYPDWLSDNNPAVINFPTGGTRFFWTPSFDGGAARLVAVQSTPLGSHGDYVTSVWVALPGRLFSMKTYKRADGSEDEIAPDPKDVALLIDFSTDNQWIPRYPVASLANGLMRFSNGRHENSAAEQIVKGEFGILHAQEAVKFAGKVYFVAGAPMRGPTVAYRLNMDGTTEIECVAHWKQ